MSEREATPSPGEADDASLIRIVYSGGLADEAGALLLDEYAEAVDGWKRFLRLVGEPYFRSAARAAGLKGTPELRVEVRAQRRGSHETLVWVGLTIAGGLLGNAAYDAAKVAVPPFLRWCRTVIKGHTKTKRRTTNIDEVAANLRRMSEAVNVELVEQRQTADDDAGQGELDLKQEERLEPAEPEVELSAEELVRLLRELADAIDNALRAATKPLDQSAERVSVGRVGSPAVVTLDRSDRIALQRPLELPIPSREWRPARIRFVRIHRESGEVTFRFIEAKRDRAVDQHIHNGKLLDKTALRGPNNPFTSAFNADVPLNVLLQQQLPTPGRLKPKYKIQLDLPPPTSLLPDPRVGSPSPPKDER